MLKTELNTFQLIQPVTFYHTIMTFNDLENEAFSKHSGKRRKCWLAPFSPSPTMFSTLPEPNFNFPVTFILLSSNASNLVQSKILSFDKELVLSPPLLFYSLLYHLVECSGTGMKKACVN